jgi:hypothetical protein
MRYFTLSSILFEETREENARNCGWKVNVAAQQPSAHTAAPRDNLKIKNGFSDGPPAYSTELNLYNLSQFQTMRTRLKERTLVQ